jgi:hypothetical protein
MKPVPSLRLGNGNPKLCPTQKCSQEAAVTLGGKARPHANGSPSFSKLAF